MQESYFQVLLSLKSKNPQIRKAAAKWLSNHPCHDACIVLHDLLICEEDSSVIKWLAFACAKCGCKDLNSVLKNQYSIVREYDNYLSGWYRASIALLENNNDCKKRIDHHKSDEVLVRREAAIESWVFSQSVEAEELQIIISGLSDPDETVRQWNSLVLSKLGKHEFSKSVLAESTLDDSYLVREWSAHSLGLLGATEQSDSLRKILEDSHPRVREWASRSLSLVGSKADMYRILASAMDEQDILAKEGMLIALIRGGDVPDIQQYILNTFETVPEHVRLSIVREVILHSKEHPTLSYEILNRYTRQVSDKSLAIVTLTEQLSPKERRIFHIISSNELLLSGMTLLTNNSSIDNRTTYMTNKQYTTLVVTALPLESTAVKATFDYRKNIIAHKDDPNLYTLGVYKLGDEERCVILVTTSSMGKSNASTITTHALRSFPDVKYIIMCGIAGGCPNVMKPDEHIRLGDVVISDSKGVLEWDNIKKISAGQNQRSTAQRTDYRLLQVVNHLESESMLNSRRWEEVISKIETSFEWAYRPDKSTDILYDNGKVIEHPQQPKRRINQPYVHQGRIACGDVLLKCSVTRDELRDNNGVIAVEMESSGIQTAAWASGRQMIAVRGICDYCDNHKNDVWQQYSAVAAASYVRAMIESMPLDWLCEIKSPTA